MPEITIDKIKEILVKRYEAFNNIQLANVLSILKQQGKARHIDNIKAEMYTLDSFILSDEYYLTNLDIWILALELNIPIIFISSTRLKENKASLMSIYGEKTEWIFIKSPPIIRNQVGSYRLIKSESYRIKSTELSMELNREIENNLIELNSYIENFKDTKKNTSIKEINNTLIYIKFLIQILGMHYMSEKFGGLYCLVGNNAVNSQSSIVSHFLECLFIRTQNILIIHLRIFAFCDGCILPNILN